MRKTTINKGVAALRCAEVPTHPGFETTGVVERTGRRWQKWPAPVNSATEQAHRQNAPPFDYRRQIRLRRLLFG